MSPYTIEQNRISVRPLAFLLPVGIAFMALLALMPVTIALMAGTGFTARSLASYILVLPLIAACLPLLFYSRRQVIFDNHAKMIYRKTIWGTRALLPFSEVADIIPETRFGIAYYIKPRTDYYGRGLLLSPPFTSATDKAKQSFDSTALPAIRPMLASATATAPDNTRMMHEAGVLQYYTACPDGYRLLLPGFSKFIPVVIFSVLLAFTAYGLLSGQSRTGYMIFICLGFLVTLASATRRVVFLTGAQIVRLSFFSIPMGTYRLSDFAGFQVVRKTHNGIYNGTDVRMTFTRAGSRRKKELTLRTFRKTAPIESFITETAFVSGRPTTAATGEEYGF